MKRATLIALTALFAFGLSACDRPGGTNNSAQRSGDATSTDKDRTTQSRPANAPTGTPPASK